MAGTTTGEIRPGVTAAGRVSSEKVGDYGRHQREAASSPQQSIGSVQEFQAPACATFGNCGPMPGGRLRLQPEGAIVQHRGQSEAHRQLESRVHPTNQPVGRKMSELSDIAM